MFGIFKRKKEEKRPFLGESLRKNEKDRREAERWRNILHNIVVYDGTERGQRRVEY